MKNTALILVLLFFSHLIFAQNYIDLQQNRIDLLDGVQNLKANDSTFNYLYFTTIDEIQELIEDKKLSKRSKKNIEEQLYFDLAVIDQKFINTSFITPDKYKSLVAYLKALINGNEYSFLEANAVKAYDILNYIAFDESAERFIMNEVFIHPEKVLKHFNAINNTDYAEKSLSIAVSMDPIAAKRYFNNNFAAYEILKQSEIPSNITLLKIHQVLGRSSKAYVLLDAIHNEEISLVEADNISKAENNNAFLKLLIKSAAKKDVLAKKSIDNELEFICIRKIRPINAEFEDHDGSKRYNPLKIYSAEELYTIIVYSQAEIFTSSFTGAFEILMNKLENEKIDAYSLLENVGFNEFRTFLKMCAGYGKLELFLSKMSNENRDFLIKKFININESKDVLKEAVSIADGFGSISDSNTLVLIEEELHLNYKQKNTKEVELAYGLLIALFNKKAVNYKNEFLKIAEKYPIPAINYLDSNALFGKDSIHTQIHFFYSDDDGIASYNSFINQFKHSNWKISYLNEYVLITSIKGKKVQILANKPIHERTAPKIMLNWLLQNKNDIEVLVHRGHSFYVDQSLSYLSADMKLVLLGSCGGYHQVLDILNEAPQAQIIATKQVGSLTVNDPLIFQLVSDINKGKEIDWEVFWLALGKKFSKGGYAYNKFIEYVPPYQNLGAGFIQAYRKLQF